MAKEARTVDEAKPDQFVMPAGEPSSLYPPVKDLVFKRDRRFKGLAYRANVEPWFENGSLNGGPAKVGEVPCKDEKEPDS